MKLFNSAISSFILFLLLYTFSFTTEEFPQTKAMESIEFLAFGGLDQMQYQIGGEPGGQTVNYNDSDWSIAYQGFKWKQPQTNVWFRASVTIPEKIGGFSLTSRKMILHLNIDNGGDVFVNGDSIGSFEWGPVQFTISDKLQAGDKFLIAIRGINKAGFGELKDAYIEFSGMGQFQKKLQDEAWYLIALKRLVVELNNDKWVKRVNKIYNRVLNSEPFKNGDEKRVLSLLDKEYQELQTIRDEIKDEYNFSKEGNAQIPMWFKPYAFELFVDKVKPQISEFIYTDDNIPSYHASTLVELENGDILAAWFGGKEEGDNSVEILMARRVKGKWSSPVAMTNYPDSPTWNPVLFRDNSGKIWLFFKVGPTPTNWTGACRTSIDNAKTWSEITYLPAGLLGPVKNKPIQLANGNIVSGSSVETDRAWSCWTELSSDNGKTWSKGGPITVPNYPRGVIQPTLWEYKPGKLKMLMRSNDIGFLVESSSEDGGFTWTSGKPVKALPTPGKGIDAVRLKNNTIALVYNHEIMNMLNLSFSNDNGITWSEPYIIEKSNYNVIYPSIIQTNDGLLHITYTWNRERIKYVVVDPKDF